MDLKSFQTTASRISARLSENLSETARDLGLQGFDAASIAGYGSAGKYLEEGASITEDGIRETRKLLETRREASMAEGLRRVLAMMLKGRPVLSFFPQVVQCLSSSTSPSSSSPSSSIQIRSLVSIYILRQAALEPDLALLPVNMYQKDLRDPNPVIRALAIRTLAGMGLESITALVLMSLKTASRDSNWFVRRTVAESLEKVHSLDPSHISSLLPILETLLSDRNALVLGSSLAAYESIAADRIEILHPHYRRLCRSLVDTDEWTQIVALRVLERYAREQFADPNKGKMHPDLDLLLKCVEPLFYNRNAAVVLAAVRVYYRLAPDSYSSKYIQPLLRLLQAPAEIQAIVLATVVAISSAKPTLFSQQQQLISRFYISQSTDSPSVRSLKLQILILLANSSNIREILTELLEYIRSTDEEFVGEVVQSIGRCATQVPAVRNECLEVLLNLIISGGSQRVAQQVIAELSHLFSSAPSSSASSASASKRSGGNSKEVIEYTKALNKLILAYHAGDRICSPDARAGFFAILAENLHLMASNLSLPIDTLRVAAKGFTGDNDQAKSSLLLLSTKLVLMVSSGPSTLHERATGQLHLLHDYVTALGRYDASWSIRDLTRFFLSLVAQAGVQTVNEANQQGGAGGLSQSQQEAQDAFARGDNVDVGPAALARHLQTQSGEEEDDAAKVAAREELRQVLLQRPTPSSKVDQGETKASGYDLLLGSFRLIARVNAAAGASSSSMPTPTSADASTSQYIPQLADWHPLPDWPVRSAEHRLRDPEHDEDEGSGRFGSKAHLTSLSGGPTPSSARSGGKRGAKGKASAAADQEQSMRRTPRDEVVLVPTEREPEAYEKAEPKPRGLEAFLGDESEEEEEGESSSEETESDDSGEESEGGEQKQQGGEDEDDEETDEEESSSEEANEEEEGESSNLVPKAGKGR